ncbi:8324_t:CDS:2 [Ambispora leptoticha]|uniref:8324_t:CDS:1 n=1 Tax=Ambispora leptoticha TaxID=144679 RepID=A0A9N9CQD1_9GLOM|nr:8324_t:CDS:2 [Ambispora leptoticha]
MTDSAQSHEKDSSNNVATTRSDVGSTAASINSAVFITTEDESNISGQEYDHHEHELATAPLLVQEERGIDINTNDRIKIFPQSTLDFVIHQYRKVKAWKFNFDDQFLSDYALAFVVWFTLPCLVLLVCAFVGLAIISCISGILFAIINGLILLVFLVILTLLFLFAILASFITTCLITLIRKLYIIAGALRHSSPPPTLSPQINGESTSNNVDSEQQQLTDDTFTNNAIIRATTTATASHVDNIIIDGAEN